MIDFYFPMSTYSTIFDARGGHYNLANRRFPEARREEARAIFEHLSLRSRPGGRWLDVAAGGGYLKARALLERVARPAVSYDASLPFLREAEAYRGRVVGSYQVLPFADGYFAACACLAAFHHIENPQLTIAEMLRVSSAGARAAVGDVAKGSLPAHFLNGFVNDSTNTGHVGRFWSAEELEKAFRQAGAHHVHSEVRDLWWHFSDSAEAVEFSRELFGLKESIVEDKIEDELARLGLARRDDEFLLPWRMVFVSGER